MILEDLPPGLEYIDDHIIRKTAVCGKNTLHFMEGLCKHLIAHPDSTIVPVYSFQYAPHKNRTFWWLKGEPETFYGYQYDMMRLGHITPREEQIIWQVGDVWRRVELYKISDPTRHLDKAPARYYQTLITTEQAWDEFPKLMSYLKEIIRLDRYHDLHGQNIMLDDAADYRVIDLEGFNNSPLSQPSNYWITR